MLTTESPGRRGWRQLRAGLIGLLVSALAATACDDQADRTSQSTQRLAPTTQASAPVAHSSWPTSGWRTAPQDHEINPSVLAGIDDQAKTAFPGLRSVLVVRHGYLVVERYYHGSSATEYHNVFSVTKSVTSALVGIDLGDHQLTSLRQTVGELLGRHLPANADPAMAKITLEQLLTMTAGIPADPEHGDALPAMFTSRNWVRFVLSQPLGSRPGTRFAYSTQGSQLLSAIVTDATGQSLLAFARAKLFTPLGISTHPAAHPAFTPEHQSTFERARFAWAQDPQGYQIGGSFLKLTPATSPSSATSTSTRGDGRVDSSSRLSMCGRPRKSRAAHRAPPSMATTGGWSAGLALPGSLPEASAASMSWFCPLSIWSWSSPVTRAFRPDRDVATALIGQVILPATTK
jgi:CubicO group peptidase (beta-lactamase class C family)